MQVKQPEVESVLDRAGQLYRDSSPNQPDKVTKSNGTICTTQLSVKLFSTLALTLCVCETDEVWQAKRRLDSDPGAGTTAQREDGCSPSGQKSQ